MEERTYRPLRHSAAETVTSSKSRRAQDRESNSCGECRHYTAGVNAEPLLTEIAAAIRDAKLEAVMIGNAAAALQGAPVTTVDFDFLFRPTPRNLTKLKAIARTLKATILRPYYPASDLYRLVRDDDGLQVDFMGSIHGVRSFAGVRDRADAIAVGGIELRVASLTDIIKSKRAARRPRDLAVLEILEKAHEEASLSPRPSGRRRSGKRSERT
jgi:predicted nucleotidyltransferase